MTPPLIFTFNPFIFLFAAFGFLLGSCAMVVTITNRKEFSKTEPEGNESSEVPPQTHIKPTYNNPEPNLENEPKNY
jgi:hypothetical protein